MSDNKVFNREKTLDEYKSTPLFCGADFGLLDTIYKPYPKLWSLYKELKSLDWSEDEFDFKRCMGEFKTLPKDMCDMMIETIAWQWEADSVASSSPLYILTPFISSTEYRVGLTRIMDNESTHSATYSEIVKLSFEDTDTVMQQILDFKNSNERMGIVERELSNTYKLSTRYASGDIQMSYELYRDCVVKTILMMYVLERVQFMASFGITFLICSTGAFQQIGKAVQKICQDELEIHAQFGKETINYLLNDEMGKRAIDDLISNGWMSNIMEEVFECEFAFIDTLFRDNRSIPGGSAQLFKKWVLFNGKDVVNFLKLNIDKKYVLPKQNPMPILETWVDMSLTQPAPQEEAIASYKVNMVIDDTDDEIFDI